MIGTGSEVSSVRDGYMLEREYSEEEIIQFVMSDYRPPLAPRVVSCFFREYNIL